MQYTRVKTKFINIRDICATMTRGFDETFPNEKSVGLDEDASLCFQWE